jgi:hypothetical protein
VRTYEWGTLFADVRSGNFEMAAMTWVGVADPDLYRLAYHSAMIPPAGFNRGRYASRAMDRLTDAGPPHATIPRPPGDLHARPALGGTRPARPPALVGGARGRGHGALAGFHTAPSGDLGGLATAVLE